SVLFWKSASVEGEITVEGAKWPVLPIIATCGMLGALVALTVFAGPITDYLHGVAAQIFDTSGYIQAVLGEGALALLGQ
ncbi:MAG: monovalent cation/H+ antiporter subunit D, partial [Thalassospira sp.]